MIFENNVIWQNSFNFCTLREEQSVEKPHER